MATIESTENGTAVRLSRWEHLGALHGDVTFDESQVTETRHVDDLWSELRGIRAPGTGIPGVIMLGTTRYSGKKDFCAVYGHKPGVVIELAGHEFARVLVTT